MRSNYGSRRREARLELETHYQHRLLYADDDVAKIQVDISQIDIYYGGEYLGYVRNIPENLGRMTASVYADGEILYDREMFVVGDPFTGFEIISTRPYDGYVMDEYRETDGYRAGKLDLNRGRVRAIRHSRLFRPGDAGGYVPISLLPEDEGWLWDYGADAVSASADDYDDYYGADDEAGYVRNGVPERPLRSGSEVRFRSERGSDIYLKKETEIQRIQ